MAAYCGEFANGSLFLAGAQITQTSLEDQSDQLVGSFELSNSVLMVRLTKVPQVLPHDLAK